jgi:hypothetical protein
MVARPISLVEILHYSVNAIEVPFIIQGNYLRQSLYRGCLIIYPSFQMACDDAR